MYKRKRKKIKFQILSRMVGSTKVETKETEWPELTESCVYEIYP